MGSCSGGSLGVAQQGSRRLLAYRSEIQAADRRYQTHSGVSSTSTFGLFATELIAGEIFFIRSHFGRLAARASQLNRSSRFDGLPQPPSRCPRESIRKK